MQELRELRRSIDKIDEEIIQLFQRRMDISKEIGNYKLKRDIPIFDEAREREILEDKIKKVEYKEYVPYVTSLFQTIMDLSKSCQAKFAKVDKASVLPVVRPRKKSDKIGFFGEKGSYSQLAMKKFFKELKSEGEPYNEFEDIFKAVQVGEIDYGVLPVENSYTGSISKVYDLLNKYNHFIVGERVDKIEHNLLGLPSASLDQIREVHSHLQGLEQCSEFLTRHSSWKQVPSNSTSDSAKYVYTSKDPGKAAIASIQAAQNYGLKVLERNIQNQDYNSTRFILISKNFEVPESSDRISLVFSTNDSPGDLYRLLKYFAENGVNLVRIESRPMPNHLWDYLFYTDLEGSIDDPSVLTALHLIKTYSDYFKILGTYKGHIKY